MDTILGLIGLVVYIACVLAFSAAVTYAVVRLSPAQAAKTAKKQP